MNRSELREWIGLRAHKTITQAAYGLCLKRIAEHDNAFVKCFRLVDPMPAGLKLVACDLTGKRSKSIAGRDYSAGW
jgi:hypothetical protein